MKIVIYSTSICAACHTLTGWLDSKEIKYEKKIVDEDQAAMTEFMDLNEGMVGVPFTVFFDESNNPVAKITGFDQKAFNLQLA